MDSYFVVSLYVGDRLIHRFGPYLDLEQAAIVADRYVHGWTNLVVYVLTVEEVCYYNGKAVVLSKKYEVKV